MASRSLNQPRPMNWNATEAPIGWIVFSYVSSYDSDEWWIDNGEVIINRVEITFKIRNSYQVWTDISARRWLDLHD